MNEEIYKQVFSEPRDCDMKVWNGGAMLDATFREWRDAIFDHVMAHIQSDTPMCSAHEIARDALFSNESGVFVSRGIPVDQAITYGRLMTFEFHDLDSDWNWSGGELPDLEVFCSYVDDAMWGYIQLLELYRDQYEVSQVMSELSDDSRDDDDDSDFEEFHCLYSEVVSDVDLAPCPLL